MSLLCLILLAKFLSAHAKDRHTPSAELELAKAKLVALQCLVDSKEGLETELQTGIPLLTPSTLRSAR